MGDWGLTLILWLIPVSAAVLAWLMLSGVTRGIRLRIALAVFVIAFVAMLLVMSVVAIAETRNVRTDKDVRPTTGRCG